MTDRELANKVLHEHNQQCFAELVRRYSGMVFSKALGIVKREELAKEIAQQTFVRAYERLAYWRGDSLGPWLAAIAMHLALNELEHEKRLVQSVPDTDEYDPEREVLLQRMEQAIELLPEQDRQIIRLHYYEQKKTDEIARFTGLTQTNVLVRLHRIRERLRRTLGEDEEINRIQ
jgi:RNA polymerase sigma-70 factor (ECF subfamily)